MKNSMTKNYIYNLTYQILTLIFPLITAPYISRVLGATSIGIYSYTLSISAYFILLGSLGVALYGEREIAYNQKDKKQYSIKFWEIVILRAITMAISIIIFYFTFSKNGEYAIYYKILLLEIIANCLDISWLFQGLEDFKIIIKRNLIVKIISIICMFVFIKSPNDLKIYYWIYVISLLVGNGSLWLYLPKILDKVQLKELHILRHLKPTINLFIPQIAIQIYTLLDRTMIGTIVADKSEVGYYDQSQKIIKMLLTVITSLEIVMIPRVASTYSEGDENKIKNYMKESFAMVFFLSIPMIFGTITISDAFVPIFFGKGYDEVVKLMNTICPILLIIGISNVIGKQYLLPTKRENQYTISVIIGATINFILNSFLIAKFGAMGASIATVVAEMTVTGVQLYFTRNEFEFKKIMKLSINYIIAGIIMFIVCLITGKLISNNVLSIIVQSISGTATYLICLYILKDAFMLKICEKLKIKINNK